MKDSSILILGITGQVASYLADYYLENGYKVYGLKRRASVDNEWRIQHIVDDPNFEIVEGDISDAACMNYVFNKIKPDFAINTAAMSHVGSSFTQASSTFHINAVGVLNILESIKSFSPKTRLLQMNTSEMFGSNYSVSDTGEKYQDENTPFAPNSPYAVSKAAAHHLIKMYRDAYDMFCCATINFNTESPKRGEEFVTRKITRWIGRFYEWSCQNDKLYSCSGNEYIRSRSLSSFPKLRLGNMKTYRDWSHVRDIVKGMDMILQRNKPDDFLLATGKTHTVEDFCQLAFREIGIENWRDYIFIDPKFYRPLDVEYLCGKPHKAKQLLGWEAEIPLSQLVKEMVKADIQYAYASQKTTL